MSTRRETCPDCQGRLATIQIIDKKERGLAPHGVLEYAIKEASMWTGKFPVEGKVIAYMCDGCGRVLLYAQADE